MAEAAVAAAVRDAARILHVSEASVIPPPCLHSCFGSDGVGRVLGPMAHGADRAAASMLAAFWAVFPVVKIFVSASH